MIEELFDIKLKKEETLKRRRQRSKLEEEALFEKPMLMSSSNTDEGEGSLEAPGPSTIVSIRPRKRGRKNVVPARRNA